MKLLILLALLASPAFADDFNRAPWDKYGCTYKPDGKAVSYPCIDNREVGDTAKWPTIQHMVNGHTRVETVFDLCDGEYGCVIDGEYHTTYGDVGLEQAIRQHWASK